MIRHPGSICRRPLLATAALLALLSTSAHAQSPGDVSDLIEIAPELLIPIPEGSDFGASLTDVGDLDGNGTPDLVIGAPHDKDANHAGAVWILFLQADGTLVDQAKISGDEGGIEDKLGKHARFGASLAHVGDLDGDGVSDLAVGAPESDAGGKHQGAVWILFMNPDGTVKATQEISEDEGGLGQSLSHHDEFGTALARLGDVDGDGIPDLAVSAINHSESGGSGGDDDDNGDDDDDGGGMGGGDDDDDGPGFVDPGHDDDDDSGPPAQSAGSVFVLLLNSDGTVKDSVRIAENENGFGGDLDFYDHFGAALASPGDLNGDGVPDLAVGAPRDDDGGFNNGATWVLMLAADGTVAQTTKLVGGDGVIFDPGETFDFGDGFGSALAAPGDVDGDGLSDLLIGAPMDDDAGEDAGAVYVIGLAPDGSIVAERKYSAVSDDILAPLAGMQNFGMVLGTAGDVDGNGSPDLLLGVPGVGGAGFIGLTQSLQPEVPFVPDTVVFDGKPGRSILVPVDPDASSFEDFIDNPVVVITNSSGEGVVVRVGASGPAGDVTFGETVNAGTGSGPIAPSAGNFSAGGGSGFAGGSTPQLLDLVVANRLGDSFSFLESLPGPGPNYAPHVEHSLLPDNGSPLAVVSEDFDGDGNLDAAFAGNQGVSVFLGDGLGGFPSSTFTPVALLTDLAVGDVNRDSIPDLVTSSGRAVTPSMPTEEGFATVLLGVGDGTFTNNGTFATGVALASVLMGPLDPDASLDVLLVGHAVDMGPGGVPQGSVQLWLGDNTGGFSASPVFGGFLTPNAQGIHPTLGSIADIDGDGDLDAVYSSNDSIAFPIDTFAEEQPPVVITSMLNDGAGSFAINQVGTAYAGKGVAPILGDIFEDPNENVDAILVWYEDSDAGTGGGGGESFTTFVTAFVADDEGGFFDPSATQFATGDEPTNGVAFDVDTNGSGRVDLVIPNLLDNSLTVLFGDGSGGVTHIATVPDVAPLSALDLPEGGDWLGGPRQIGIGHLDGDDFADGIVYSDFEDLSAQDPGESPRFAALTVVSNVAAAPIQDIFLDRGGELAVGPINGDSRPDAAVTQRLGPGGPDTVLGYLTQSDGTLKPTPLEFALPAGVSLSGGLAFIDVDDMGRTEIVTTGIDTNTNEGVLIVLSPVAPPIVSALGPAWGEVRSVAAGDVDSDGVVDVALGFANGELLVAQGLGNGSFGIFPIDEQAAAVGGGAVALGDVNGDLHTDIISSTSTSEGQVDQAFVRVLLGDSLGGFTLLTVDALQSTGQIGSLAPLLVDLDYNGALDLVLVHGTADSVSFLVNQLSEIEQFGLGKAGGDDLTPELRGSGFTRLKGHFELIVSDGVPGNPGLVQLGLGRNEAGPWHVVVPVFEFPVQLDAEGHWSVPLVVPDMPELVGFEITGQAMLLDHDAKGSKPAHVSASNGLAITFVD